MKKYAIYNLSENEARRIVKKLNDISNSIVNNYSYTNFGFSNMADDGYKGIIFNLMYGNELIHNIEYEQTLKNLNNNNSFRINDEKDEDFFLNFIIEIGEELPNSYWEKTKEKEMKNIIEIEEEVKIGNIILEKGDTVRFVSKKGRREDPKKDSLIRELYTIKYTDKSQRDMSGKSLAYIRGPGLHSLKKIKGTDDYEIYDIGGNLIGKAIKEDVIEIQKEVRIGEVILEAGDKIEVLKEAFEEYVMLKFGINESISLINILLESRSKEAAKLLEYFSEMDKTFAYYLSNREKYIW